jgi:hypothetical protein
MEQNILCFDNDFLKWQIWNIGRLMSPPSSHLIFQDFEEETILHRSFFFSSVVFP